MTTLGLFSLMGLFDRNTSPSSVVQTTTDMVVMAEDMGFETAWFSEHHFTNHSICPSSLMMVSHLAHICPRIRLGTGVLAMPFHNPLRLVQEVAFADVLTSHRLILGIGAGFQPQEFYRFGIDAKRKVDIMMETWDILEQGLTQGFVEYKGEFYDIPGTTLPMRPFGFELPPIYVAGSSPILVGRAARSGYTPFMSFGHRGLKEAMATKASLEKSWYDAAPEAPPMPLAVQRFIFITEDPEEARHAAACVLDLARANRWLATDNFTKEGPFVRLMPFHDDPPLDDVLNGVIIGSADHCAERLALEIDTMKMDHLSCFMGFAGIGRRESLNSLESFGTHVLPQLESRVRLIQ